MPADTTSALDAFIAARLEIDTLLVRLKALSDDHFAVAPGDVHWGHVGTLGDYRDRLRAIADAAFREGEHAG